MCTVQMSPNVCFLFSMKKVHVALHLLYQHCMYSTVLLWDERDNCNTLQLDYTVLLRGTWILVALDSCRDSTVVTAP